ncbi:MAG: peroxiredoxin [Ramlibacter sp.]|nr:peroxiredoxin [Ramlibacter sp.]
MAVHTCKVTWERGEASFTDQQYSRAHEWRFDGGAVVPGSSSPHSVKLPWSDPAAVDPEEAFVAAVSSCHMLWFLYLAAARGLRVDRYADAAEGLLAKMPDGREGMTQVVLRPDIAFSGARLPDAAAVGELHHEAHARCYIANSIRSEVRIEGSWHAA